MQYRHLNCCAIIMIGMSTIIMSKPLDEIKATHGNLALSTSQQPGPIFAFGQNIVDEQDALVYEYVNYLNARDRKVTQSITSLLYGLSDRSSLFISIPVMAGSVCEKRVRGIQDIIIQGEYAWYANSSAEREFIATLVANISFPTAKKDPTMSLGIGSVGFFVGLTASYTGTAWYAFTSYGLGLPTKGEEFSAQKQFLYQVGAGYNVDVQASDYIALLMIELDGVYSGDHEAFFHRKGHNDLFIIPSLWFSNEKVSVQFGYACIVAQHNNAISLHKEHYRLLANVAWKF